MKIRTEDQPYFNLFLFVIGFLLIFSSITHSINIYDEGISILGSLQILDGKLPYQDFWTIYAPAQFYIGAGFFDIFGDHLFYFRLLSILIDFAVCIVIYLLASKIYGKKNAFIPFLISAVWFSAMPMFGRAVTVGILAVLLSNLFLFFFFEKNDKKYLFLAGLMIGISALFRHEMAGYIYGAEFWAVFFSGMPNKTETSEPLKYRIIKGFLNGVIFTLGVMFIFVPFAMYFLNVVDINILYENLIKFPLSEFREYRSLPLPTPLNFFDRNTGLMSRIMMLWEGIIYYLPLLSFGLTAYFLYWRVRKKKLALNGEIFWKEMLLFNIGLNFYNQALVRSDLEHLIPAFLIFSILFLSLILIIPYPKIRKILIVTIALFVMLLPLTRKIQHTKQILTNQHISMNAPKANFTFAEKEYVDNYNQLISFIKTNTSQDEYIYSGNTKHDKFISNDLMLYFLSDRKIPTKYYELHPGLTTTEKIQSQIMNDLIEKNVNYLVLLNQETINEPNKSSVSSNVFILDEFIRKNYYKTAEFGSYLIMKKY